MTRRRILTLLAAFLAVTLGLAFAHGAAPLAACDRGVQALADRAVSPALTPLVAAFTALGGTRGTLAVAAILGVSLLMRKRWRSLVGLACIILGIRVSIDAIKPLVARARPLDGLVVESGFSYPSDHAIATAAIWTYVAWLASRHLRPGPTRRIACGLALLMPLLVGLSRIYLNVHWLTDILGGWAAGTALALAAILLVTAGEAVAATAGGEVEAAG
jgi:membrane-associated phospholipid phosphatase